MNIPAISQYALPTGFWDVLSFCLLLALVDMLNAFLIGPSGFKEDCFHLTLWFQRMFHLTQWFQRLVSFDPMASKSGLIRPNGFKEWSHLTQWFQRRLVSIDPVVSKKIGFIWPSSFKEDLFHLTLWFERRLASFDLVVSIDPVISM
jgi:hypothetical protein